MCYRAKTSHDQTRNPRPPKDVNELLNSKVTIEGKSILSNRSKQRTHIPSINGNSLNEALKQFKSHYRDPKNSMSYHLKPKKPHQTIYVAIQAK